MATKTPLVDSQKLPPILLNNEPSDIAVSDLFGTLPKAESIKDFLEAYHNRLGENKMFALYGEWGSGKSSILKYLDKHLAGEKFETIFFETWQNEKDDNLPLSLAYMLAEKAMAKKSKPSKNIQEFKRASSLFLKCFLKGLSVKIGNDSAGFEFSGKDMIEGVEDETNKAYENESFSQKLDRFKDAFQKMEDEILGKDTDKRLIVFIDDLDRCETENILTLISAVKLFFTYGKRTIFLCGIDKRAVMHALQTKYHDVVKAEEYLEKVFDINWSMPPSYYPYKLIESTFPTLDSNDLNFICQMFSYLNFQNPRHLKKVLNKYELLRLSKESKSDQSLIPYILDRKGNGDIVSTLLVLLFISIYEFRKKEFQELEEYEAKRIVYEESIVNYHIHMGHNTSVVGGVIQSVKKNCLLGEPREKTVSQILRNAVTVVSGGYTQVQYLSVFLPCQGYNTFTSDANDTLIQFSKDNYGVCFARFLMEHKETFSKVKSGYIFWNFFKMCKTLL